jgi:hypothetical protein
MSDFWTAVLAGVVSPAALLAAGALFRNQLLDYFVKARLERVKADINAALETQKGSIAAMLEGRKGEIAVEVEKLKSDLNRTLETHRTDLARETRQLESAIKRSEESYQAAIQFGSTVDLDLRAHRIKAYEALWKMTSVLPRWPRAKELTYRQLKEFSADMRVWYFEVGGLYLSERSMRSYNDLQEKIWSILDEIAEPDLDRIVQGSERRDLGSHYDSIRLKCSKLRTSLTSDVLSRRLAPDSQPDSDSRAGATQ